MMMQLSLLADQIIDERLNGPKADFKAWRSNIDTVDESQLSKAYVALIHALQNKAVDLKPIVTNSGAPLLSLGLDHPEQAICHPAKGLELSILWQLVGYLTKDSQLFQIGVNAEQFIRSFTDRYKRPFIGIWTQETDVKTYIPSPSIARLLEKSNIKKQPELMRCSDPELGCALHHGKDMSLAFTVTGWGSGVGSIMRQDVGVIAMGPQAAPFEDASRFGIHFTAAVVGDVSEHKPLPGMHVDERGNLFTFNGWTRSVFDNNHLWCHLSVQLDKVLDFKMQFLDLKGLEVSIAMAVKADAIRVGDKLELITGSLKQYRGEVAPVALEGKNSQLVLIPKGGSQMRIVPLAGDESCWQADFLILYLLDGDRPEISWTIN